MSAKSPTHPSRTRILFVDDSRLMRACAKRILSDEFELVLAESAEQAWETLQDDNHIAAVFSDLHMEGKSGFDLLEQIRGAEADHLSDLPVVVITGEEDGEKRRKHALMLGATDFISKPFQASELMARAAAYAQTSRSARRLRLLEEAHHVDSATGLGNRRYCEERLLQAMSFAHRHAQPLALMHLRLKGLTDLLDEMGQPHASRALMRIGTTLGQRIRREDTVFRTDDETFTFLLQATDETGAEKLQQRFMPDLDELGLCPEGAALGVEAGFIVQTPPPLNGHDAARIIDEGLSGEPRPVTAEARQAWPPDIEQALRLIERGQTERVRPHLGSLRERLRPLMELMQEPESAVTARESRQASPRSH